MYHRISMALIGYKWTVYNKDGTVFVKGRTLTVEKAKLITSLTYYDQVTGLFHAP